MQLAIFWEMVKFVDLGVLYFSLVLPREPTMGSLRPSVDFKGLGRNEHRIMACEQKEQGATVERFSHRRIAMVPLTSDQRRVSSWLNCRWAVSKDCQLSTTDFVRHNANAGTVTRPVVQLMTLIQASTSLTCVMPSLVLAAPHE